MKVKEESEKVGLKLNIQKTKIMASGPITPWQIHGETVTDFYLGGSKISADGYHSCEIKRCLLLGRKKSLSRVRLFTTPWTVAYQASPSMGFSRQEYWSVSFLIFTFALYLLINLIIFQILYHLSYRGAEFVMPNLVSLAY